MQSGRNHARCWEYKNWIQCDFCLERVYSLGKKTNMQTIRKIVIIWWWGCPDSLLLMNAQRTWNIHVTEGLGSRVRGFRQALLEKVLFEKSLIWWVIFIPHSKNDLSGLPSSPSGPPETRTTGPTGMLLVRVTSFDFLPIFPLTSDFITLLLTLTSVPTLWLQLQSGPLFNPNLNLILTLSPDPEYQYQ